MNDKLVYPKVDPVTGKPYGIHMSDLYILVQSYLIVHPDLDHRIQIVKIVRSIANMDLKEATEYVLRVDIELNR